jgi:hypothetical protein
VLLFGGQFGLFWRDLPFEWAMLFLMLWFTYIQTYLVAVATKDHIYYMWWDNTAVVANSV